MKTRLYIIFMALLTWVGSAFAGDRLMVATITLDTDREATLTIEFDFTTDNLTGYQFDLVLPNGIATKKDNDDAPLFELGEGVYYKSHTVTASHLSLCDRFVCLSTSSQIFKKMIGVLLTIPISADTSIGNGIYDGILRSIQLGTKDGNTIFLDNVSFRIVVGQPLIGDVNYDGKVNVADVTALVNIILGKDNGETPMYDHEAANVNKDSTINFNDIAALMTIILAQ